MRLSRRSLFGTGAALSLVGTLGRTEPKPRLEIPNDYDIDFELLTPWGNLHYEEEEKDATGFTLELSVEKHNGTGWHPYRGAIRWWIKDRRRRILEGVSTALIEHSEYVGDESRVRVKFADFI